MNLTADDYLRMLCARISEEERADLESNGDLVIGTYNRATMLRMLRDTESRGKNVDTDLADALEVAGEPMHPQAITGWRREGDRYYCRAREDTPDSTCRWCVCRPYSELSGPEL